MTWDNFFIVQAGAAATLTGLLFVAVSINLEGILAFRHMPSRALQSVIFLGNILVVSSPMLVPNQSFPAKGFELLGVSAALWIGTTFLAFSMVRTAPLAVKSYLRLNFFLTQAAVIPFIGASIAIIDCNESGLYWLVPGIMLSFLKAVADAWILLIEIKR